MIYGGMDSQANMSDDSGYYRSGSFGGLEVLVVDCNRVCLSILEQMLISCNYKVTKCRRAKEALELLRRDKSRFAVVLSDLGMTDMDGFKFIEIIRSETNVPVINEQCHDMIKGFRLGACGHFIKPISMDNVRQVWRYAFSKRKDLEGSMSLEESDSASTNPANAENWSFANEADSKSVNGGKVAEKWKKSRLIWKAEIQLNFVNSEKNQTTNGAVPKEELEASKYAVITGVARENVPNRPQKYRMCSRGHDNHCPPGRNASKESNFKRGNISQIDKFNLRFNYCRFACSSHLEFQRLATDEGGGGRTAYAKPGTAFDPPMLGPVCEDLIQPNRHVPKAALSNEVLNSIDFRGLAQVQAYGRTGIEFKWDSPFYESSSLEFSPPGVQRNQRNQRNHCLMQIHQSEQLAGPYFISTQLSINDVQSQFVAETVTPMASNATCCSPSELSGNSPASQSSPEDYVFISKENFSGSPASLVEDCSNLQINDEIDDFIDSDPGGSWKFGFRPESGSSGSR